MSFEAALLLSLLVHLTIFTLIQIVWLFQLWPEVEYRKHFALRALFAIAFWQGSVEVCDGCPFTHVENRIAVQLYDEPFYPDYSKQDSVLYSWFAPSAERLTP